MNEFFYLDKTAVDATKIMEAIKLSDSIQSGQQIIEIDGLKQTINIGDNQHVIILQEEEEKQPMFQFNVEQQTI